jgi:hypothetical protein
MRTIGARSGRCRRVVLVIVPAVILLLSACVQHGNVVSPAPAATSKPSSPSPDHSVPTQVSIAPPYTLPYTWKTSASGSLHIGNPLGYKFAPTNSKLGYACTTGSPPFHVTSDGGSTWSTPPAVPFSSCDGVFVPDLDSRDVFVAEPVPYPSNPSQGEDQLWRSRDGGASWQKLGMVQGVQEPLGWSNLAMVQGRLIGSVQINGEGYIQNPLYVSDDGGLTWQPLANNVASQGYSLSQFAATDSVIFISGTQGVGSAGLSASGLPARTPLIKTEHLVPDSPLRRFSGNPQPTLYWRSVDGGVTWSRITLPGGLPLLVLSSAGSGYYGLSSASQQTGDVDGSLVYDTTYWWSAGIGSGTASWTRLPSLSGIEHGYVIAGSDIAALASDGTVFVAAQHDVQSYGDDAGVFLLHPGVPSDTWQPVVAGRVQYWQAVVISTGLRLWGVGALGSDQGLKYVDISSAAT